MNYVYEGNNTWRIEIKARDLRSLQDNTYSQFINIVYNVDPVLKQGQYELTITDLELELSDENIVIDATEIITIIQVERYGMGLNNITGASVKMYISGQDLFIESPFEELIEIYSISGVRLFKGNKEAGQFVVSMEHYPEGLLIIKSDIGWNRKIIRIF